MTLCLRGRAHCIVQSVRNTTSVPSPHTVDPLHSPATHTHTHTHMTQAIARQVSGPTTEHRQGPVACRPPRVRPERDGRQRRGDRAQQWPAVASLAPRQSKVCLRAKVPDVCGIWQQGGLATQRGWARSASCVCVCACVLGCRQGFAVSHTYALQRQVDRCVSHSLHYIFVRGSRRPSVVGTSTPAALARRMPATCRGIVRHTQPIHNTYTLTREPAISAGTTHSRARRSCGCSLGTRSTPTPTIGDKHMMDENADAYIYC